MFRHLLLLAAFCAALLLISVAQAADKEAPKQGTIAGLVTDKQDTTLMVRTDGAKESVKYVIGDRTDPRTRNALKNIYVAGRVELTYKMNGDAREVVGVRKVVFRSKGSITGEVLYNHQWWVEVKPKSGFPEGYAAHYPFDKNQAIMDKLKDLQTGDIVMITFTTDGERHRIESLQKVDKK